MERDLITFKFLKEQGLNCKQTLKDEADHVIIIIW